MICVLTSAFRPDKEVTLLKPIERGYFEIFDPQLNKTYVVPADQIDFREIEVDDLI